MRISYRAFVKIEREGKGFGNQPGLALLIGTNSFRKNTLTYNPFRSNTLQANTFSKPPAINTLPVSGGRGYSLIGSLTRSKNGIDLLD